MSRTDRSDRTESPDNSGSRGSRRSRDRAARRAARPRTAFRAKVFLGVVLACAAAAAAAPLVSGGSADSPAARADDASRAGAQAGSAPENGRGKKAGDEDEWDGKTEVLGDGSTSYTGPQPGQLKPERLEPGEKPPQFVVFSWDGALQGDDKLFSRFRQVAKESDAHMTLFLTGIYLLPESKRQLYKPPRHATGASAISYPTPQHIRDTLDQLGKAWTEGNEIGSHFNGHFCGTKGGGDWSSAEWTSEIDQAVSFVKKWKTNTGFTDLPPLPFDPDREFTGGRAPCLEGQKTLLPAAKGAGWRYDASSAGDFQIWPAKKNGVWDFPLQLLPWPQGDFQVLSMDFNLLYNQSDGSTDGDPAQWATWRQQAQDAYKNGFERVYNGSRAPLFIGNHFEEWNGGIYMDAVENVMRDVCPREGVRCVSFRELADWMDAQDPAVLAQLRNLDPAQEPLWKSIVR
ncbi:hypothetical protein [Streptomyces sp. NPDC088261]|uniref:hypothetical protein n=1 Tax=Streptomyces sp. NPDC088261 TaxID=3365851 RepID=UPI0037F65322